MKLKWGRQNTGWLLASVLVATGCQSADMANFKDGVAQSAQGHPTEAAHAYLPALETNPGLVEARLNLGGLLNKQGNYRQVEQEFRLVLSQDPLTGRGAGKSRHDARSQGRLALT